MFIKKCFENKIYILLIIILFFGAYLRHYNYLQYPRHGATFDEFAWTWLGINLIQKHEPISWSSQPQYSQKKRIIYQGAAFLIVRPYLEHPPLFGLVAGSFSLMRGTRDMYDVTLSNMRPLSLILGVLSIFFIFLLTKEIYGVNVALFSSLVYATVPTIVIGSRILQNENFLIPFWLLSLYLIIKYLKTGKKRFRNIAAVIAGLLSLAKVPWLVVGISLSMILSYKGRWRDALSAGIIVLSIFSLYIFYGIYFDKDLFINLLRLQTARYDISFTGIFSIFTSPLLVDRFYLDGWILFGWISIFFLSKNFQKHFLILIPFIAYLIVYIFAIPNEPSHGWYRYPFYPFLIISSTIFIRDEFRKITMMSIFFIFIIGFSLLSNVWAETFGFSYIIYRLFIIFAAASVLPFLWISKYARIGRKIFALWTVLFIIFNIFAVFIYLE